MPSSCAPSPRHATHSSSGPKSCTKPNTTSAIVGPSATAIESAKCGSPRLALTEPSIGSITTSTSVAAEVDDPALLADRGEARARGVQRARARRRRRPRPPRRSAACGRRPRRACRSPCTRSAIVGRSASIARIAAADRRHAPSQSAVRVGSGGHAGLSYGGACRADLRPARGRRARRRPAARARRRGHREDDGARRALRVPRRAHAAAGVAARADARDARDALRERIEDRLDRALRGADGHDVRRPVRAAAARRGAGGGDRPVRDAGRAPPTGSRCCSSASTTCRCATTTCAATRARRSARSCAGSTSSRTS